MPSRRELRRSINEDSYQMQKLSAQCSRPTTLTTARVPDTRHCRRSGGNVRSGAMTNSFDEFSRAKMFLVDRVQHDRGHPVAATFLKNAVMNGAKLILVDPRRHKLADFADLHVPIGWEATSPLPTADAGAHREDLYDKAFVNSCTIDFDLLERPWRVTRRKRRRNLRHPCGDDPGHSPKAARSSRSCSATPWGSPNTPAAGTTSSPWRTCRCSRQYGHGMRRRESLRGQNNVRAPATWVHCPMCIPGYQKVTDDDAGKNSPGPGEYQKLPGENG